MPQPTPRTQPPIRVLLVDDHPLVLDALEDALRARPEFEVVGDAASVRELEELDITRPDVVLMDYRLPDGTGADGCRVAKARWPDARVVILTGYEDEGAAVAAISAGADGFLLKSRRVSFLVGAIRDAFERRPVLSPELIGNLARRLEGATSAPRPGHPTPDALTPRELGVLRFLARGRSTREIASELGLSQGTVRVHVEAIRRKFHVSSRLEAVSSAIEHHIVQVG